MSPAAFSHDCAPQTGHEPTEEEPLSDSTKQIAVGPKKPKGISKFWTGVAVFSLGGGIVSAISSHKDLLYGVGRPKKSNQGNIAHLTNAPLGAGAAGHLALPPPQAALPMAFPLVARAPHNEAPAAMSQLRRDFEECLHEVAPANLKPSSRRLAENTIFSVKSCLRVVMAVAVSFGLISAALGVNNIIFRQSREIQFFFLLSPAFFLISFISMLWSKKETKWKWRKTNDVS
eukprot:GHVT01035494.1.p1 GENE.GHVT01035494.1~~GHVT01035494.1.p1  ORF type:complete len:231 (+),score=34.11 GHVT01035494.1:228-920(+)